ncbi:hypothetical protein SADUNF_Sadunf05G0058600 [Salix dunnii]|uniref:WRKY domain-containing protein n=1 Tax=Salix dunnii TaxID=1413687 RepID=A0A835K3X3_9ROSI|nr:hypothetical protein SADUNF_Sadunf05G0058600 [Salix dunnii]
MPTIFYPCPSLSGLLVKPRSPTLLHAMDFPDENPNHYHSYFREGFDPPATEFQVSDYLVLDNGFVEDDSSSQSMASPEQVPGGSSTGYSGATSRNNSMQNGVKKNKIEGGHRVAFRTKSELEVMDDGFKWRKYGKKSVKNSPNPRQNDYFDFISSLDFHRNYYKCSSGGCDVKKIVERDREDSTYVITTYDGVHNHESPCMVLYNNQMPMAVPQAWTLQDSSPHSSSSS